MRTGIHRQGVRFFSYYNAKRKTVVKIGIVTIL